MDDPVRRRPKLHIIYICVLVFVSVILLSITTTALYQYHPINQNLNKYTHNPGPTAAAPNHEHSLVKRKGGKGKFGGEKSSGGGGGSRGCNSTSVGTVSGINKCRHVVATIALLCVFIYYF
jgi:uncharacterized membrane protein YgcG